MASESPRFISRSATLPDLWKYHQQLTEETDVVPPTDEEITATLHASSLPTSNTPKRVTSAPVFRPASVLTPSVTTTAADPPAAGTLATGSNVSSPRQSSATNDTNSLAPQGAQTGTFINVFPYAGSLDIPERCILELGIRADLYFYRSPASSHTRSRQ